MKARLDIDLDLRPFERVEADLVITGLCEDDRPLRGGAARADWRLCGLLSGLLVSGRVSGAAGETLLVPSTGGLRAPRLLVMGLGPRRKHSVARIQDLVRDALQRALDLGQTDVALAPLGFAAGEWSRHADAVVGAGWEAARAAGRPLALRVIVPPSGEARAQASFRAVIDALGRPEVELGRREEVAGGETQPRRRPAPQGQAPLHRSP